MNILAIDPGIDQGWATFVANVLTGCGLGVPFAPVYPHEVYIECPQIYPAGKGDPNDLIKLAIRVGHCLAEAERSAGCLRTTLVYPRQWKGQTPKPVNHRRIRATLSASEIACLDRSLVDVTNSLQHNVLDAVGIGLYAVGRLRP